MNDTLSNKKLELFSISNMESEGQPMQAVPVICRHEKLCVLLENNETQSHNITESRMTQYWNVTFQLTWWIDDSSDTMFLMGTEWRPSPYIEIHRRRTRNPIVAGFSMLPMYSENKISDT